MFVKRSKLTKGFMTWIEASETYAVSVRTLKDLARAGKLTRYRQHGRHETLLKREQLERVLAPRPVSA
ncbi:MAG TPA: helix-turn-helix domain-containing protein [Gemmataceae bacterium]|jgi:hypothetical protein